MIFSLYDGMILSIFIISLTVFFQRPSLLYLKLFPGYFLAVFFIGMFLERQTRMGRYNTGIANIWSIVELSFNFFVLHEVIINRKIKKFIVYVIFIFAAFALFNVLYIQKTAVSNPINNTVESLISTIFCIYYFVELFQKVETPSLATSPAFWIVSAILFNTVLSFPLSALVAFMAESNKNSSTSAKIIFNNIELIMNIVLFLTMILYSIAFLCRIKIRRSIS